MKLSALFCEKEEALQLYHDRGFLCRNSSGNVLKKKDRKRAMRDKGIGERERERNRLSKESEATVNTSMLK